MLSYMYKVIVHKSDWTKTLNDRYIPAFGYISSTHLNNDFKIVSESKSYRSASIQIYL